MSPLVPTNKVLPILVFNPLKRLVGVFGSQTAAARAFDTTTPNIKGACDGRSISCRNLYFRVLDPRVEVTFEDFGTLRLEEYDQMCGLERRYYLTKDMSLSGKRTKKQKANKNNESQIHKTRPQGHNPY